MKIAAMEPIDLYQLDIFLQVAVSGSMSAAAVSLGLSQSAVSQAVAQLEKSFDLQLIDRSRRPLALTAAGVFVAEQGEKLVTLARSFKAQAIDVAENGPTSLRIGMIDSVANTVGVPLIKQLLATTTSLSVQIGMAYSMEEALRKREVDLVISTNGFLDSSEFEHQLLYQERYLGIIQKQFATQIKHTPLPELTQSHPFIRFSKTSALGVSIERILKQLRLEIPKKLEVDHADTVTLLVTQGLGWAITTPTCLLQTASKLIDQLEVFTLPAQHKRSIYLAYRRGEFPTLPKHIAKTITTEMKSLIEQNSTLHTMLPANAVELDEDHPA